MLWVHICVPLQNVSSWESLFYCSLVREQERRGMHLDTLRRDSLIIEMIILYMINYKGTLLVNVSDCLL